MPARLYGAKKDTGAAIEVLLLKNLGHNDWECLVKPAKRIKIIPFCLVEIFIVTLLIPINNHDRPSSISSS